MMRSGLIRPIWITACILLFILLLGCAAKTSRQVLVENPDSELLAMLVEPSDLDYQLSWYSELLGQENITSSDDGSTEKAYRILDGLDEEKMHVYVEHNLRCYPNLSSLANVAPFKDSDSSNFNKVGRETIASCKTVTVDEDSVIATCTILVRYTNLVSTIILRYEKPDVNFIIELGNNILPIVDNRIGDTYRCDQ